jgi:hypothetical protein
MAPAPSAGLPAPSAGLPARSRRVIRNARLVHKRIKRGRRAILRVSLTTPSRVRIVLTRSKTGRRVRVLNVAPRGRVFAVRLPARAHGHKLNLGRYRVSVVAIDGNGVSSAPFKRTLTVRR